MALKEHIDDIRDALRRKQFTSEALVSQGIVRRLLDALDWPQFNPQIVIPEYPVPGGRVDFAPCHPALKPMVFIEVKQVGQSDGAERQLFEYAFHAGVPIAVLRHWSKKWPMARKWLSSRKAVWLLNSFLWQTYQVRLAPVKTSSLILKDCGSRRSQ